MNELPREYGIYLVTLKETDEDKKAKFKREMDKIAFMGKFPNITLPPEKPEPLTVHLYADDPQDAADKAEQRYDREVELVQRYEV